MPLKLQEHVPLGQFTTFGVGGPARYFADVADEFDLKSALQIARERKLPLLVIGGGSNLIISDDGWPGLVVRVALRGIKHERRGEHVLITAAAGEPWDAVPELASKHGWVGVEALSGIPGSVGGAAVQNAGAYGQALQDVIESVRAVEVATGEEKAFGPDDCRCRYRDTRFKSEEDGRWIIVSVVFKLKASGVATFGKREPPASIAMWFTEHPNPKPSDVRNAVLDIRESKGMVIMDGRERFASAGSIFKNPHVQPELFEQVRTKAVELDAAKEERLRPWNWPQPDGTVKLSAAFLMEFTTFTKGFKRGSVGISPRQPLAIINLGGAKAADILQLAEDVRTAVKATFGVPIEHEVKIVKS